MILDTCAMIWLAAGSKDLSDQAREAIEEATVVYISSITAFEVGHKYASGDLRLPCDPEKWYRDVLDHHDLTEVPVNGDVALLATRLPRLHKDPCDRMILATAKLLGVPVVTADARFEGYGVEVLR